MEPLLHNLNSNQQKAVTHQGEALLVRAGAGSGKTRVLTHRIAYLVQKQKVRPQQILAITFTNKAASEMRDRVSALLGPESEGTWVMTFHALALRILRQDGKYLGLKPNFQLYDGDDSERIIRALLPEDKRDQARDIQSKISWAKNNLQAPDDVEDQELAEIYAGYNAGLKEAGALDFDDLLFKSVELIKNWPSAGHWQKRFSHVLVDEYQDTNPVQYALLRLLAKGRNVFCVGDEDQAIYGWRGADVRNILNFETDFPSAEVILLEQNYRSLNRILQAANGVISNNPARAEKNLWSERGEGKEVDVVGLLDDQSEVRYVMQKINEWRKAGITYDKMAIMYRANWQSRAFEQELINRGVPYVLLGGVRFLSRAEVKDVVSYLRLLINPHDPWSLKRVINTPARKVGPGAVSKLEAWARENKKTIWQACQAAENVGGLTKPACQGIVTFTAAIESAQQALMSGAKLSKVVKDLYQAIGIIDALNARGKDEDTARIENLWELIRTIELWEIAHPKGDLTDLLAEWSLQSAADAETGDGRISLITLHNAKGLEYEHVVLVGCEEGLLPHANSLGDHERMAEERRLAYVGITRAMDDLVMTYAQRRWRHGKVMQETPSRFLYEIPAHVMRHQLAIPTQSPKRQFQPRSVMQVNARPAKSLVSGPADLLASIKMPTPKKLGRVLQVADFPPGTKILHTKFGEGVVSAPGGADTVRIRFVDGSERQIMLNASFITRL